MPRPTRIALLAAFLLATTAAIADAHDLFLRPRDFIVRAGEEVRIRVLNGTFTTSEAPVALERLRALTIASPSGVTSAERAAWTSAATESEWRVTLAEPGTHVLGASLTPKSIHLQGKDFNGYLREEGLSHVVAARARAGQLADSAFERYSKHVKALVLVTGGSTAGDTAYRIPLGFPVELVPLADPYRLPAGARLPLRALADGRPLSGQVVLAGGRTRSGGRMTQRTLRTNADGVVRVPLTARGTWYVKFIDMHPVGRAGGDSVDYESRWATLTFARP